MTNYFDCPIGVKKANCLSPTLFAIFINDLANEIKNAGVGVPINVDNEDKIGRNDNIYLLNILMYVDDIFAFCQ